MMIGGVGSVRAERRSLVIVDFAVARKVPNGPLWSQELLAGVVAEPFVIANITRYYFD